MLFDPRKQSGNYYLHYRRHSQYPETDTTCDTTFESFGDAEGASWQ